MDFPLRETFIPKFSNADFFINDDLLEFKKAQNGTFDIFAYLISKYSKYTTNKVVFKLKQQQSEIEGVFSVYKEIKFTMMYVVNTRKNNKILIIKILKN